MPEIRSAVKLARRALAELKRPLVEIGFAIPGFVSGDPINAQYASGKLFFRRVWDEFEKSLAIVEVDEKIIRDTNRASQVAFDEVSLRQRKLFEALCAIIMLSRPAIYARDPGLYFLHYHLTHDIEYLRLRNVDLRESFGGECRTTAQLRENIEHNLGVLDQNWIDPSLCTWTHIPRKNFNNALPDSNPLEKTALGFGYHQVFGAASSLIHLNMCGMYEPAINERAFLERVDNLLLLTICTILRAVQIVEIAFYEPVAANSDAQALRNEFRGTFPDNYPTAAIGAAEVDDIVAVFEAPDIFLGRVKGKRETGRYVSYDLEPLRETGRAGFFTDAETMVIIKAVDQHAVIQEAVTTNLITQAIADDTPKRVLLAILDTPGGQEKFVKNRIDSVNMPSLFFVQKYLQRAKQSAI